MAAVETGQMSAVETRHLPAAPCGLAPPAAGEDGGGGKCLVSTADICPVSTADISISIHHSASAFSINNQHIMEAATAADFWLRLLAIASLGSDKIASRMRGGSLVVGARQGSGFHGLVWVSLGPLRVRHGPVWIRVLMVH